MAGRAPATGRLNGSQEIPRKFQTFSPEPVPAGNFQNSKPTDGIPLRAPSNQCSTLN